MDWSLLHPFWAVGLPVAASLPLGWLMRKLLDPPADRVGRGVDAIPMFLVRLFGHREPAEMGWRRYAMALLAFNAALFVLSFAVLWAQHSLPLNPDGKGPLTALGYKDAAGVEHPGADTAVIFNTVCSFVTNTNLQHYSGEQHLSYFSQLGGIVWLQFVTPACGLAVMLAVIRGLRGDKHLGDFYLDTARSLVFALIPLAVIVAVLLVSTGMPMTFQGAARAATLEGGTQTIARGPVAAEVAIKQLGTNGGGFFNANGAHPFENPTGLTNVVSIALILCIPVALTYTFGRMVGSIRQGVAVLTVMTVIFAGWLAIGAVAEHQANPAVAAAGVTHQPTGNMEGKEVRFGDTASALYNITSTQTSTGSVNSANDSYTPMGGFAVLTGMMLG